MPDGGETTAQPEGDPAIGTGIRVHTSTAVTENKIVLADVPTIHIVRYGPAMLLVDPFSAGRSTTGETQIVIQNYVDNDYRSKRCWSSALLDHCCCRWLQEWPRCGFSKQGEGFTEFSLVLALFT